MKTLFKNATLLDVNHKMVPKQAVLVEDDKIIAVGEAANNSSADKVIDVQGKTLMPGLIDAHIHLALPSMDFDKMRTSSRSYISLFAGKMASLMLQQGFTTVRDACGLDFGVTQAIDEGIIKGPRILFADRLITKTGGHGDNRVRHDDCEACPCHMLANHFAMVADGVSGVRKATREVLRRGATQIKIATTGGVMTEHNSINAAAFCEDEIRTIVAEAKDQETYVMAHAHGTEGIRRAVECGVRTIEHCTFLTPEIAELMRQHNTYMSPTLYVAREILGNKNLSARILEKMSFGYEQMFESIKLARKHNVKIGFGSDAFGEVIPGHAEEFLIRSKIEDPYDLIISATATNAEMMQQKDSLGVIKEGAIADLIIVDGDPLQDLSLLAQVDGAPISLVMKGGEIVKE